MVGVNGGGVDVAGCVTNAFSSEVGVAVASTIGVAVGWFWINISVDITLGVGDVIVGTPPIGVGV